MTTHSESHVDEDTQAQMAYVMEALGQFAERVMVFIDAGYLQACVRDQFQGRAVDLEKFVRRLVGKRRLVRAYYYTSKIEKPPDEYWKDQQRDQQKYLAALAYQPFIEVRLGRLQFGEGNRARQKGVDVLLAIDMLRFALKKNYDTAILVSGDGDFADIVKMVKDEGLKVETLTFPKTRAWALTEAADLNLELTGEILDGCWLDRTPKK